MPCHHKYNSHIAKRHHHNHHKRPWVKRHASEKRHRVSHANTLKEIQRRYKNDILNHAKQYKTLIISTILKYSLVGHQLNSAFYACFGLSVGVSPSFPMPHAATQSRFRHPQEPIIIISINWSALIWSDFRHKEAIFTLIAPFIEAYSVIASLFTLRVLHPSLILFWHYVWIKARRHH